MYLSIIIFDKTSNYQKLFDLNITEFRENNSQTLDVIDFTTKIVSKTILK